MYLHSLTVATGDEVRLGLAVAETGQHPAVLPGLALESGLLPAKVQSLDDDRFARFLGVSHDAGNCITDESLSLVSVLAVGDQRHPPSVQAVAASIGLRHRQMVGVQVHANCTTLSVRKHRHIHHPRAGENPPALRVPLEPVADGLPQRRGPRRLLTMLTPVLSVLGVAPQGRQDLLVPVSKPHALHDQVLAILPRQAIRQTQPQGQRAIIGNGSHAELASRRFIPAAEHEELVATGIPPVPEPFLMTAVAVCLEVVLLAPQPLRPEAQPHSARRNVSFQCSQPVPQIGQPPFLLMNLTESATFSGIGYLPLGPNNPALQVVQPQLLLLLDRCHLAFQQHPRPVEHPRRYPVPLQVHTLQRGGRPAGGNLGKQIPLHPAVQLGVGVQCSVSNRTVHAAVIGNASLIGADQRLLRWV